MLMLLLFIMMTISDDEMKRNKEKYIEIFIYGKES